MSSIAGTYNITADQGKTLSRTLTYGTRTAGVFTPFDNSGMSARMQVRRSIPAAVVELNLTTAGGEIVLGGANGQIVFSVDAVTMEDLSGVYVYDLELVSGSIVYGVVRGSFHVRPEVTR
jgi:hypothetical protein